MRIKKLTSLIAAGILAVCAVPMGAGADILKGDINQDGVVNSTDYDLIIKYFYDVLYQRDENYTDEEREIFKTYGDINGDGYVTDNDAIMIAEMYGDETVNTEMGDINHDGYVDAVDATAVMDYYAALSIDNYDDYTEEEHENFKKYGDLSGDGIIDTIDSTFILIKYSENATPLAE